MRALARQVEANEAFVDDLLFLDLRAGSPNGSSSSPPGASTSSRPTAPMIPAVTHADIASLCGGSRENVTRILSDLQRRDLLREGQRYVLKKVDGLARIAGL